MRLIPVPVQQPSEEFNPTLKYPSDVARMVEVAKAAGYDVSLTDAATIWLRYSDGLCASWLSMPERDADLLSDMLKYGQVVEDADAPPLPPAGYPSWLDYAVATLDTRSVEIELLYSKGPSTTRQAMKDAALAELEELRQRARH